MIDNLVKNKAPQHGKRNHNFLFIELLLLHVSLNDIFFLSKSWIFIEIALDWIGFNIGSSYAMTQCC